MSAYCCIKLDLFINIKEEEILEAPPTNAQMREALQILEAPPTNAQMREALQILEAPPTNAQMREALQILRRGVQHRTTNVQRHYEYEQFIQEILIANKQQTTLHSFLNKFCCFLYI